MPDWRGRLFRRPNDGQPQLPAGEQLGRDPDGPPQSKRELLIRRRPCGALAMEGAVFGPEDMEDLRRLQKAICPGPDQGVGRPPWYP